MSENVIVIVWDRKDIDELRKCGAWVPDILRRALKIVTPSSSAKSFQWP